ncbi:MAG: hypothetical protein A2172_00815 [Candidatus Woykebacteria bacterium RBG_13_40_15]|uniref:Four helix bundle protein n=1 Tax=Candidatus Woykebacteria bacterium RBG_13_40_15 TaxID=1802593 RepID=A0A1G1W944_9BACT|nr:MAG: hypothetical protein A2172_00815 [Candidatus Woykebacteria bacterium RBG_13_40_15]
MPNSSSFEKIKAWQKGHLLALEVYKVTKSFPREEAFGLTSQLQRAAISVPTNIAEGYARQNNKVFGTFLDTAYASLVEIKYLLKFSAEVGYISKQNFIKLESLADEVGKVLWKFMKEVKSVSSNR